MSTLASDVARGFGSVSPLVSLTELSDGELLSATRRLVGRSNQLLALLLGHLAELEARGLHRTRACSSLYTYCIYELRFSEDEAYRRVAAARLVRRFPTLLDAVASGELHLTGLLMLGPHLTAENLTEVLARSKHRTKKEIARLVRQLDPLPDVPSRIEPLGPASVSASPAQVILATPTYRQFIESLCPVRELPVGDRPREWMEVTELTELTEVTELTELTEVTELTEDSVLCSNDLGLPTAVAVTSEHDAARVGGLPAPARLEPQRYRVEFTAGEEYVKLVEAAQALLSHSTARVPLGELQLRAMRALVSELERRKRAAIATKRPTREAETAAPPVRTGQSSLSAAETMAPLPDSRRAGAASTAHTAQSSPAQPARSTVQPDPSESSAVGDAAGSGDTAGFEDGVLSGRVEETFVPEHPRRRGRHVPAAVRRAVFERDQGRCAYMDATGRRCRETQRLELHHLDAFATGGEHTPENLQLRCRSHNALAAEQDFGAEFIQHKRDSSRHESYRRQTER